MLGQQHDVQVFIALGATDMRKSINGLSIIVEEELGLDLFTGNFFAFCNRNRPENRSQRIFPGWTWPMTSTKRKRSAAAVQRLSVSVRRYLLL